MAETGRFKLVCHSERREESTAAIMMSSANAWILRCAQNDNKEHRLI